MEELLYKKITEAKEKAAKDLSAKDVPLHAKATIKACLSIIDIVVIACLEEEEKESKKSRSIASFFIKKNKKSSPPSWRPLRLCLKLIASSFHLQNQLKKYTPKINLKVLKINSQKV